MILRGLICATLLAPSAFASVPDFATPATPPGVTVEPAIHQAAMQAGLPNTMTAGYFTDPNGMTLYVYAGKGIPDPATWPALAAPADAKPVGDWSIQTRPDGARQWAHRGRPLYLSAKDKAPGDTNGRAADNGQWQVATLQQSPDEIPAPAAVTLKPVNNALGDVFVDYKGMTLYVFDDDQPGRSACVGDCTKSWIPLKAAELAKPLGDWTTIRRDDGTRQWAYRSRPLYSFAGDGKPGDAKGMAADGRFHPAAVRRQFMPAEVTTRINGGLEVFAAADGRTLYARDRFRFSFGGYSVNDGPPPTSAVGRAIGAAGCAEDCTKAWRPLIAPSEAQASGHWSIALRPDGSRQWAYQGYPVYTYAQDKEPGDMLGRDLFDLTDGSHALYWRVLTP